MIKNYFHFYSLDEVQRLNWTSNYQPYSVGSDPTFVKESGKTRSALP